MKNPDKILDNKLRDIIFEPKRIRKSTLQMQRIVNSIFTDDSSGISEMSAEELDDVQRLIAAILSGLRAHTFSKLSDEFKPRQITKREEDFLDKTCRELKLENRWKDHISAADTTRGPAIVLEPYGLDIKGFEELLTLSKAGWHISLDDRFATYFPGTAVCILLWPPSSMKNSAHR